MNNPTLTNIIETLEIEVGQWNNDNQWTTYINGIKFELKDQRKGLGLTVAYHTETNEFAEAIEAAFEGYEPNKAYGVYYWVKTEEELTALALRVRDFIIETGLERVTAGRAAARRTDAAGFFEKTAAAIKQLVDIEAWDFLNGRLNAFDDHDDIITIGKDAAVLANPDAPQWREHIVPCTMIKEEAIRMAQAGATIPQIAQMLKENLAIVIITAEEAKTLDSVYQTTMPAGWTFGDSIFARLDAMNIAY